MAASPNGQEDNTIKSHLDALNIAKNQLEIGTDVSAKYRGAWCEGKVIKRQDIIMCKVAFESGQGTAQCKHSDIKGTLGINESVMALDSKSGHYLRATIQKLSDGSLYTVRFPDGDERTLKRNAVTLMGPQHYNNGDSLGSFPMTDPDEFGAPIPVAETPEISRKRRRVSSETNCNGTVNGVSNAGGVSVTEEVIATSSPGASVISDADEPSGTSHQVVLVNPIRDGTDDGQFWWPALIVPAAEVMRDMIGAEDLDPKTSFVVRFFEDNLFAIIPHEFVKQMQRNTYPFERFRKVRDGRFLKLPAVQRALKYLDYGNLPTNFKWKTWSDKCDKEAAAAAAWEKEHNLGPHTDKRWNPNPIVERNFNASLYEFMSNLSTPIKRTPSIGFKDLDLFKLYTLVARNGGYTNVTEKKLWRQLYGELLNQPKAVPANGDKTIRSSYEKYLLSFERQKIKGREDPDLVKDDKSLTNIASPKQEADVKRVEGDQDSYRHTWRYEIGNFAKCSYKDGKRYTVIIEDRRAINRDGKTKLEYRVHYQNWAKRYDQWIDSNKIHDVEDSNVKKRPRVRTDIRKEELVVPAVAIMEPENTPVGENFVPEPIMTNAESANVSPSSGSSRKSRKSKGQLTDEELAQTLALAEVRGRRRETRGSISATSVALTQQKNALLGIGVNHGDGGVNGLDKSLEPKSPTKMKSPSRVKSPGGSKAERVSPTKRHAGAGAAVLERNTNRVADQTDGNAVNVSKQSNAQPINCYVPTCIGLSNGWKTCYSCSCGRYKPEKAVKSFRQQSQAPNYAAKFYNALAKYVDEPIPIQLEYLQKLFGKHTNALRHLMSDERKRQKRFERRSAVGENS